MMRKTLRLLPLGLSFAAAIAFLSALPAHAQKAPESIVPAKGIPETNAPVKAPVVSPSKAPAEAPAKAKQLQRIELTVKPFTPPPALPPDRALAYSHFSLAGAYEEEAVTQGHPEFVTRAIA